MSYSGLGQALNVALTPTVTVSTAPVSNPDAWRTALKDAAIAVANAGGDMSAAEKAAGGEALLSLMRNMIALASQTTSKTKAELTFLVAFVKTPSNYDSPVRWTTRGVNDLRARVAALHAIMAAANAPAPAPTPTKLNTSAITTALGPSLLTALAPSPPPPPPMLTAEAVPMLPSPPPSPDPLAPYSGTADWRRTMASLFEFIERASRETFGIGIGTPDAAFAADLSRWARSLNNSSVSDADVARGFEQLRMSWPGVRAQAPAALQAALDAAFASGSALLPASSADSMAVSTAVPASPGPLGVAWKVWGIGALAVVGGGLLLRQAMKPNRRRVRRNRRRR